MVRCIAIDDEPMALRQIKSYIERTEQLELVAVCRSAMEAQEVLKTATADLLFVDINMPDMNGLAFVRSIDPGHYIVFTTAHPEFALEGFKLLARLEGIIPAIESAHAVAYAIKYAKEHKTGSILACLSGRGDKDIDYVYENYGCGEKFKLDYNV